MYDIAQQRTKGKRVRWHINTVQAEFDYSGFHLDPSWALD